MPQMRATLALLLLATVAACDNANPAEVRSQAATFPLSASWSASAAPVSPATVRATLGIKQYLGFRMDAAMTITGAPNTVYQWRIFRGGDCTLNVAAVNNTAPTGLVLFETIQSYPDVTTNATGTGTVTAAVAGALDSVSTYSVRVRVAQSATNWNGTSPIACGTLQRSAGG